MLVPPINFALVVGDFYRSGHPIPQNYPFLEKLGLKTIIYIGDRSDEENEEYWKWADSQGIRYITAKMHSVKEPFFLNDPAAVTQCINLLLDKNNYPVLVHSNKGKHRVGVLAGVFRHQLLGWSLSATYDEYMRFAKGKAESDFAFIELFSPDVELDLAQIPAWLRLSLIEQRRLSSLHKQLLQNG